MSRRYRARKDRRERWYREKVAIINHWSTWSPRYLESYTVDSLSDRIKALFNGAHLVETPFGPVLENFDWEGDGSGRVSAVGTEPRP